MKTLLKTDYFLFNSLTSVAEILDDFPHPWVSQCWVMGEHFKSISGFIISLNDSPISWSLKQQAIVILSSCEAEYISCTHCAKQILWLHNLLAELSFKQNDPTTLMCNNTGTVACTHDPHSYTWMKHILIWMHFIHECVNRWLINIIHISNQHNIANLLTKPLGWIMHAHWLNLLNLCHGQGGCWMLMPRSKR